MVVSLAIALGMVALGLVAFEIYDTQGDGRRQLEQRFAIRADLASRFVETYAAEILTRERAQATTQLAKPRVAEADFKALVAGGGYQAAVLLDAQGRLLQVVPAKPALIGKQVGSKYPHLRSALKGNAAVSPVVPSAANGAPVVGFATPFDTPQGRRVLSGAFDIRQSPLANYLPSVTPIRPSVVDLIDADGTVIASSRGTQGKSLPPVKLAAGQALDRSATYRGREYRISERPVAGTPWRMVVTVPSAQLYAPLSTTGRWFAWAGLVIAALASLLVALLVGRLLKTRTELVADIAQRRVVERQLSDAQTRLHRAFAEAPIGMALVDLDGRWRQVNQALCTMLRYSEAELLTATRDQLTHADDLGQDMEQVAALIAGESTTARWRSASSTPAARSCGPRSRARSSATTTAASRCTSSPRSRTSPSAASSRPSSPTWPTTTR